MNRMLSRCEPQKINKSKLFFAILKKKQDLTFVIRWKSYYEALGLNPNASQKEIKSAYYELSLIYHPDKNDGNLEATEKFRKITEAYKVLGNPEKKKVYDAESFPYSQRRYNWESRYTPNYKDYNKRYTYTGRTKDYDYDEHFKQHYGTDYRRKNAEEYFRKHWNFSKRSNEFYNEQMRERQEAYRDAKNNFKFYSLILGSAWITFGLAIFISEYGTDVPVTKKPPLYYEVKDKYKDS